MNISKFTFILAIISTVFVFACGSEVIKEVPVEVVKEVQVDKIVKETVVQVEEKVITVTPTAIPGGGTAISVDMSDFVLESNEPNPVRGGILRMTFGVSVKHTDHQERHTGECHDQFRQGSG